MHCALRAREEKDATLPTLATFEKRPRAWDISARPSREKMRPSREKKRAAREKKRAAHEKNGGSIFLRGGSVH